MADGKKASINNMAIDLKQMASSSKKRPLDMLAAVTETLSLGRWRIIFEYDSVPNIVNGYWTYRNIIEESRVACLMSNSILSQRKYSPSPIIKRNRASAQKASSNDDLLMFPSSPLLIVSANLFSYVIGCSHNGGSDKDRTKSDNMAPVSVQ